jgi:3-hydroxybutyryl-CoA dehydrogenase
MRMKTIGVLGAGVMGTGVSHALAESGHRVILLDVSEEQLQKARQNIRKNLRMYRLLQARSSESPAGTGASDKETLDRIETTTDFQSLRAADFLVENVTEKWELKQELHARIDKLDMPAVPIAVNTSAIPMARFAALYKQPERIVGMHFMNPVPLMPLVEVVTGLQTSESTRDRVVTLCRELGKTPVVVNDAPGFVSNRVLMPMINEAVFCLAEGVADAASIDQVMKLGMRHPMGPLELADLIGLDVCLAILEVLHVELGEDKYRPCPLLRRMVAAGYLGRKTGRGFHDYGATSG